MLEGLLHDSPHQLGRTAALVAEAPAPAIDGPGLALLRAHHVTRHLLLLAHASRSVAARRRHTVSVRPTGILTHDQVERSRRRPRGRGAGDRRSGFRKLAPRLGRRRPASEEREESRERRERAGVERRHGQLVGPRGGCVKGRAAYPLNSLRPARLEIQKQLPHAAKHFPCPLHLEPSKASSLIIRLRQKPLRRLA